MRQRYALLLTLLCQFSAFGLRADVLQADVLLRVKGGSWEGAHVTVQPEFGDAFPVHFTEERFPLEFGLQATYLLRAEHAGCPTKQILFDCNVPAAFEQMDFFFPLLILLEQVAEKDMFSYAQPVGMVYFDEGKEDFIYSTDYTKVRQAPTLASLQSRIGQLPAALPQPELPLTASAVPQPNGIQGSTPANALGNGEGTALVTEPMRATHVLVPVTALPEARIVPAKSLALPPVATEVEPVAMAHPNTAPVAPPPTSKPVPASIAIERGVTVRTIPADAEVNNRFDLGDPNAECETMQTITAERCVIRIDRIATGTACTELRKVTHHYGAVFYFHDGRSITQELYQEMLSATVRP